MEIITITLDNGKGADIDDVLGLMDKDLIKKIYDLFGENYAEHNPNFFYKVYKEAHNTKFGVPFVAFADDNDGIITFETVAGKMDKDLKKSIEENFGDLHYKSAFDEYLKQHKKKFGKDFEF